MFLPGQIKKKFLKNIKEIRKPDSWPDLYGDGHSGRIISEEIIKRI